MRADINRLVYVLLGAALAVGLLVSAFVRPEPTLVASEDCYGPCASVTVLSLSSSTVTYDNEQVERFSVKVTAGARGAGVPTEYVVVESGTKILCVIHLYRGTGSCSPAASELAQGSYKIVAHYDGDENFMPSTSSPRTLTVLRH
jgi:Bacterial Ig-like domain (group 3)